ncbi:AEC family transporter [Paenibacillus hexagrammi]|uniref:Transporter n=1 Tax=Paenibacillus hexagrammi TaxID=2908839 RepID=A0ABY3SRL9_9BACL|nr:hypothetical protein [Paenibacillus sp. YPD9-1]UJF36527.1 hypothetical protein L0M14_26155 [Paenibacillus sp. YPD9-1]
MSILYTFYHIMLPLLIPVGIGAILHRRYKFDLNSFSKLIIHYYVPALAFVKIYEAELSTKLIASVFGFLMIQFIAIVIIGYAVSRIMGYSKPLAASFSNSVSLTNNGNVGIPINALAFKQDALAMSIQVIVVVFELFVTFTFGLLNASKTVSGLQGSLVQFAKMPVLYAIIAGTILKLCHIQIPDPILLPLDQISSRNVRLRTCLDRSPDRFFQAAAAYLSRSAQQHRATDYIANLCLWTHHAAAP